MMNTLGIASLGFLIGAMGQWAFYYRIFPRLPDWLVMVALFIPWVTVYTISFCNRAPFGPRPFRHCLIFAMSWYAAMTLLAEALHFFIHPAPRGHFSLIAGRVLMYVPGAISITVFVRACISLHRFETKPDG
jgi:hypothetical protein